MMKHPRNRRNWITVKPCVGEALEWAKASYASVNAEISVQWKRQGAGRLSLQVKIPPNVEPTVGVPKNGSESVRILESGVKVWSQHCPVRKVPGMFAAAEQGDWVAFTLGSGAYDFAIAPEK
jgi:hypothetical protein